METEESIDMLNYIDEIDKLDMMYRYNPASSLALFMSVYVFFSQSPH